MDINSAELQVKRLLQYVEDLAKGSHKMYGKSKTRLKDVATTCSEVVRVIYSLLEDESLSNMDEVEFAPSANPDITGLINDMQKELDKLKSFVSAGGASDVPAVPSKTSTVTRKQVLMDYSTTFENLLSQTTEINSVHNCAKILHLWFSSRFMSTSQNEFHYNIRRLADWVRDIVIVYGYHLATDTEDQFISKFEMWCQQIQTDKENLYAVPYFIYSFNRYHEVSQLTLTAVVLWDILLDSGLSKLCTPNDDLYPSEDSVYQLCGQYSPSVLDDYSDYKLNSKLLTICKLIKD